ncbi:uncharacterized protein LOC112463166 [Temnothorax curvispinosus]|uniref:Uncharacterized protein LOC112463166 n=1 Tax=Temnothorax curvispinosus TaxID=300111 RepID=A0A6J1QW71_9HYME|nr:uncharacterized protein LOC112463166 [Temnothorax curvispinosus]
MPLMPRDTQSTRSTDFRGSASPGAGAAASPGTQTSSTDLLLQCILSKIEESDKKFAARLDELDKKFTAVFERSDKKISAFIDRQEAVNADFARKFNQIPDILKIVGDHGDRIAALEAQNAQLLSSQRVAGESSAAPLVSRTSDIIISGIPSEFSEASGEIAGNVLTALGIPHLVSDVLETRDAVRRVMSIGADGGPGVASASAPDGRAGAAGRRGSVIVALKSREIRDHVLKVMRARRRLTVGEVFGGSVSGNIYVNELLPAATYNLLRRTRIRARQSSYRHVWSRDGRIFVRKDRGQPPILIASDDDLAELQ